MSTAAEIQAQIEWSNNRLRAQMVTYNRMVINPMVNQLLIEIRFSYLLDDINRMVVQAMQRVDRILGFA